MMVKLVIYWAQPKTLVMSLGAARLICRHIRITINYQLFLSAGKRFRAIQLWFKSDNPYFSGHIMSFEFHCILFMLVIAQNKAIDTHIMIEQMSRWAMSTIHANNFEYWPCSSYQSLDRSKQVLSRLIWSNWQSQILIIIFLISRWSKI